MNSLKYQKYHRSDLTDSSDMTLSLCAVLIYHKLLR